MRRAYAAAAALIIVIALGYGGARLWRKSDDLLRPVIVARDADAAALLQPSIGARIGALTGGARAAVAARPKLIALTFDDGPYPVATPLLLATLRDLHVPATFFLIGLDAERFPDLARAIRADGHEVANHTRSHPNLDQLDDAGVGRELAAGAAMLGTIAADPAERTAFRPPHGRYRLATIRVAQAAGYTTVLWNDDPGDWRAVGPDVLLAHIAAAATAPEILLLHSGRYPTVAMLPRLVTRYRAAGYTFVTAGTLLQRASAAELNHPAKNPLPPEEPAPSANG